MNARPAVAAANAGVTATPRVRALADRLGVRLADVTGTGAGGRVTPADVRAAAPREPAPVARLVPSGMPTFTASGLAPSAVLAVPTSVRRAVAVAPTAAIAHRLTQRYGGLCDEEARVRLRADREVPYEYGGYGWPTDPASSARW